MINKSFNMRLWNVTFYKIRACCTYFSKFIRPLIAPMPYMCSNPLNVNCPNRGSFWYRSKQGILLALVQAGDHVGTSLSRGSCWHRSRQGIMFAPVQAGYLVGTGPSRG